MRLAKLYSGILIVFCLFFACSSPRKTASEKKEESAGKPLQSKNLSDRDRMELDYLFFNANKERIIGNYETAYGLFQQCLLKDPKNDAAWYALAQISHEQKRYAEALEYIKKAISINPKNSWYLLEQAKILWDGKMYKESAEVYATLVRLKPESIEYYLEWANALVYSNKISEAIKVYEKIEEKTGINPDLSIQKEKLYIKQGKIDKAADELLKLIAAYPKEVSYYGMLAELYQANGMNDKALAMYTRILEIDPENPIVHLSLADYYRSIGDKEKSFSELRLVFKNKDADLDTKYKILSSFYSLLDANAEINRQAQELNQILVDTHPNESGAHVFYGEYLFHERKFEDARDKYKKALELDNKNFLVWQQLLRTELELKNYAGLVKESEEALSLFPTQPLIYYLNGIARIQLKQYKEAVEILEAGAKLVVDNIPLQADFYANIGDAHFKLKNMKESDSAYDKALTLDPKNANTLNNYSYYLSLRGDSLSKAERMSRISNELEPNNSYYQDTYGWILYKQSKYEDAKSWIEKAIKNRNGESGVIYEHYGDILYKLGDTEKAVEYWEKSRKAGGGSEQLEKKLRERKLYE
jgi:tetratricopeptide (TPR) repeat protein